MPLSVLFISIFVWASGFILSVHRNNLTVSFVLIRPGKVSSNALLLFAAMVVLVNLQNFNLPVWEYTAAKMTLGAFNSVAFLAVMFMMEFPFASRQFRISVL